jgi:hypothetical protein
MGPQDKPVKHLFLALFGKGGRGLPQILFVAEFILSPMEELLSMTGAGFVRH